MPNNRVDLKCEAEKDKGAQDPGPGCGFHGSVDLESRTIKLTAGSECAKAALDALRAELAQGNPINLVLADAVDGDCGTDDSAAGEVADTPAEHATDNLSGEDESN